MVPRTPRRRIAQGDLRSKWHLIFVSCDLYIFLSTRKQDIPIDEAKEHVAGNVRVDASGERAEERSKHKHNGSEYGTV